MEYPGALHLETTQACPARCGFCPHAEMNGDPKVLMSWELFRKIINEAATWPVVPHVLPFLTNEGFADKRMPDLLAYVNEKLPTAPITFYTIGALFTNALLERLTPIRNLASIVLSLHHYDPLAYQSETGLSHEKTLASIDRFLAWNERERKVPEVTFLRVSDGNQGRDKLFHSFVEQRFPGHKVVCSWRWNWKGDIPSGMPLELDHVCGRHQQFCIRADGTQALCCMDQNAEYGHGNVSTQSILSLYNSERARFLRTHTKREGGAPCDGCSMRG